MGHFGASLCSPTSASIRHTDEFGLASLPDRPPAFDAGSLKPV